MHDMEKSFCMSLRGLRSIAMPSRLIKLAAFNAGKGLYIAI